MTPEEIEKMKNDLKAATDKAAALEEENKKLKTPPKKDEGEGKGGEGEGGEGEGDINDRVRKEREETERRGAETKKLEKSIKFNLSINEFAKTNSDLLPQEIPEILKAADKDTYSSPITEANTKKVAIVKSFFSVQANVDSLTATHQKAVKDYFGLTQEARLEKVGEIYENIFEPALETARRVKKAIEVSKSRTGLAVGDKAADAYISKIAAGARKAYLGEKGE